MARRPPKNRWLQVRVTQEQEQRVKQLAAQAGLDVSEHVRRAALGEPVRAGLFSSERGSRVPAGLRD